MSKIDKMSWEVIEIAPGKYHLQDGVHKITGMDGKDYLTAKDIDILTKKHNGQCCGGYDSDSGCCPYEKIN